MVEVTHPFVPWPCCDQDQQMAVFPSQPPARVVVLCRHVVIPLSVDLQTVFRGRAKYISPRTRTIHHIVDSKKLVSRISFWVLRDYQNQLQILPRFTETIRQHLLIEHSFGARIRGAVLLREPGCLAFASLSILPSPSMAKARVVYSYIQYVQ